MRSIYATLSQDGAGDGGSGGGRRVYADCYSISGNDDSGSGAQANKRSENIHLYSTGARRDTSQSNCLTD
ncbi:hypothetical protein J6590_033027 [Homalodisca vitripennis]|nr:hypothetical protein J6590_033027 [Homalodisca vitripennis]